MRSSPALLKTFNERVNFFLIHIYDNGGNEYRTNDYNSLGAYLLAGCENLDEFNRVMEALKNKGWMSYEHVLKQRRGLIYYFGVKLTEVGIKEAEKGLPQMPLAGLVTQEITTGDSEIDGKINHAKRLFFSEPSTLEHMRSACVTLCAVLEPIRYELTPAITKADMNDLFQLINKFDIRHNNDGVTHLKYPEQLEWVFYSLLNTINAYTKLKKRLQA